MGNSKMNTESQIEPNLKHKYVFPNIMAKMMGKMPTQVQMEASMMSLVVIIIGLIITAVYVVFFSSLGLFYRIITAINGIAGFIFLSSFLVTSFQQYVGFMAAQELQKNLDFGGFVENDKNGKEKNKN